MSIWSAARLLSFSTAAIIWSLVVVQLCLFLVPGILHVSPGLILLTSLYLSSTIGMHIGRDKETWSHEAFDPKASKTTLALAVTGAFTLQIVTTTLHLMAVPVGPAPALTKITSDLFLKLFVIAFFIPVAEEVTFRHMLWNKINNFLLGYIPGNAVEYVTCFIVSMMFAAAHIPAWGVVGALFLLPLSFFLGWLRMQTQGIATSFLAHAVFNGVAVIWEHFV